MSNITSEPLLRSGNVDDSVVVPVGETTAQFTSATVLSEKDQNSSSTLQTELETTTTDDHTKNNTENTNHTNGNSNINNNSFSDNKNSIININDNNIKINNIIDNKIGDSNNNNINTNGSVSSGSNGLATSSSSSSSSIETTTRPYVNEGLELWNRRRELWTNGNHDPNSPQPISSENRNNPALVNITPHNYNSIYDSLVHEKKKLAKPIPLSYVIKILVSGWKRDGVWPLDPPSASSSNANGSTLH